MVDSPHKRPVLVVDDEEDNLDAFRFNFRKTFQILTATGAEAALEILRQTDVACIVTDQRMPRMTGLELLAQARVLRPDAVGIIVTAYTDVEVLIEAINQGTIYRYVTKPWDAKEMRGLVLHALERFHLVRENRRLEEQLRQYTGYLNREIHGQFNFGAIIGESDALKDVLAKVEQVAPTNSTVLLRGETGTGKELVAHAIHINSSRESGPFVRVNCAALAPGILESELFGHEKGAFTGAVARRSGRFELADGGTLFLDEVGDLPMEVQIKLLRALQEREFERVGGAETIKVDVRVVSATNRNLEQLISEGDFREDLYYRLNVFPVHLPPLRDRRGDIPRLVEHLAAKFGRGANRPAPLFSDESLAQLSGYPWPGNVRELENVVERAIIVARGTHVTPDDLDFGAGRTRPASTPAPLPTVAASAPRSLNDKLYDEERREIASAIERESGNIAGAARSLGINRSTLYYRLRKLGLDHLLPNKATGPGEHDAETPLDPAISES